MNVKELIYHFRNNKNLELNFGDKVELGSVPKLYLHIKNKTAITERYRISMSNFYSKPPNAPDTSKNEERPSR